MAEVRVGCHVPSEYRHLRWHVLRPTTGLGGPPSGGYEVAEWVDSSENGSDGGHWVRWGKTGDFPSLTHASYVGPFPDQGMLDG